MIDLDAKVGGTPARPTVLATVSITDGRVRRLPYERLAGKVDYSDQYLRLDLRLDQAPDVWLTAAGIVPLALVDDSRPDGPLDVTITSSSVGLGLIEALTNAVREVSGTMQLNVPAIGTARDPVFTGTVGIQSAAFLVSSTASGTATAPRRCSLLRTGSPSNGFGSRIRGAAPWSWLAASAPVNSGSASWRSMRAPSA